jgi:hypothetical protein
MDIGNRWTRVLVDAEPRLDCRAKWLCVGSRLKLDWLLQVLPILEPTEKRQAALR